MTGSGLAPSTTQASLMHSNASAWVQELGPRFTLKLVSLQKGTFDTKCGEFEWLHKRGEMDTSRRKFHI
jgi:hypothetical protein